MSSSRSPIRPGPYADTLSMVSVDFDPTDLRVTPCAQCRSWWVEVVRDDDGAVLVREWHEPTCTEWPEAAPGGDRS